MFVDTHSHIYAAEFKEDIDQVIERAVSQGVERIYMPNIDKDSITDVKNTASKFSGICIPQMGLHPCYVKEDYEVHLREVEQELSENSYSAIGEIGLDFYWDKTFTDQQFESFNRQIEWSKDLNLPIVIHSRESLEQTISAVSKHQNGDLKGIFHCFGGSLAQAKQIMDLGFYMGIGGVLTFKNSGLDKIVKEIDIQHLVLETDAPYLTPTPHRGQRNESSYIPLIATKLAEVKDVSLEDVSKITSENANKVYKYTPL